MTLNSTYFGLECRLLAECVRLCVSASYFTHITSYFHSLSPSIVYVTEADMCSSLKAIEDSLDAADEVESLRCNTDTKCLNLDCSYNFFIGVTVASRMKITLKPCASTPSVGVKMWIQGTRVSSETYLQSTVTTFTHLGVTTRMTVTVTQEIYGVIFGVSLLHVTQHLGVLVHYIIYITYRLIPKS